MFGIKSEKDINIILEKIKILNESLIGKLTYNQEKILKKLKEE